MSEERVRGHPGAPKWARENDERSAVEILVQTPRAERIAEVHEHTVPAGAMLAEDPSGGDRSSPGS
jgi:hypothetical protein